MAPTPDGYSAFIIIIIIIIMIMHYDEHDITHDNIWLDFSSLPFRTNIMEPEKKIDQDV